MPLKMLQGCLCFQDSIQWFNLRLVLSAANFVDKSNVAHLNIGGIDQHDIGQVHGCRRAMDVTVVSPLNQVGHIAKVVYMRMGDNGGIYGAGVEGKI
jgi:hypothetical protein